MFCFVFIGYAVVIATRWKEKQIEKKGNEMNILCVYVAVLCLQ